MHDLVPHGDEYRDNEARFYFLQFNIVCYLMIFKMLIFT
jgi:hypothetical protein